MTRGASSCAPGRRGCWAARAGRRAACSRTCSSPARTPAKAISRRPGDIRAYDVLTGKLVWTFHTIPRPGEFGYDTWPPDAWKYAGGANSWGEISIDEKRGIAYVPTGSPTHDLFGGDRKGANLFGNTLARARRAHRQAALALPDGAPRSVGLRPGGGPEVDDRAPRRTDGRHRGAAHQDGPALRVRPRDRPAAVADRGAPRAGQRHAG